MAIFVYLHGAGGRGSDIELVAPHLRAAGHEVLGVDLPCEDEVGLDAYARVVLDVLDERTGPGDDVVVVAQSLAGFVGPLVAARAPVRLLVLVAAMVPRPGETGGEWWAVTGHAAAVDAQDLPDRSEEALFLNEVPPQVLAGLEPPRDQTGTLFDDVWPLDEWPDVPTRFLLARDDHFFPADWLRGLVRERLGVEPIEVPGGHTPYLSHPQELAGALLACWDDVAADGRRRPARSVGPLRSDEQVASAQELPPS